METDSLVGDVESLLDPLVDRILVDTVSQQQGWLRVYERSGVTRERGVGVIVFLAEIDPPHTPGQPQLHPGNTRSP
ncbi:hypothetical protein Q5P01_022964 [Channa striata]|uniref:Uncharacterized protein n=1 Tax=Channa striata TaxID=64152 RepID=A0AA88LRX6_CHASR|nr:hypothetical protein Q5P01_022964 [Channa striata]